MSLYVDIQKKFGKFTLEVSFETDCTITGILGASGSGKSMTLKCISGIEKPDKGKIVLDGITLFDSAQRINLTPQERKVGYLFQNYALFPNMNVRQNILCGLRGERKIEKECKLYEVLDIMQLRDLEYHKPHQLSGGQQQRVALARILIGKPRLLMLDEPFSSLDSHLRGQLQVETLGLLKEFGKDVLMVTHSRTEAYRLCESIAILEAGRIITYDKTKKLFSNPGSRVAALITGCKNIVDAKKTGEYEVDIPQWGINLTTAEPIRDGLCAVGIRAHYFNPKSVQNSFPVHFTGVMEEPFEYILLFRYEGQGESSPDIWWRTPKNIKGDQYPERLGIAPVNVLPLYE